MSPSDQEKISGAEDLLLEGALEVFAKYGFVKTSMSDIAAESSVSRTSLYKHFPTKEHVFKALSDRMNSQVYAEVLEAYSAAADPEDKLLAVVNARVNWVYDLLHRSEFARELINEKNKICGKQVLAANDRFSGVIQKLLAEIVSTQSKATIGSLAQVLIGAVNGILESANSAQQAKDDVQLLVKIYLAGIATPG
ncbi:MAG: TetR/AcrR family transcriptional regulator [Pseudohongiellaceae bacterium]|nr:TetR/AcrR family transcriptional regulator [Pseudohongiellaceae bacterium]